MWFYESYQEFFREAADSYFRAKREKLNLGESYERVANQPPVIVTECIQGLTIPPEIRGRNRQPLPRIPGQKLGNLSIPISSCRNTVDQKFDAWLVPWRIGDKKMMEVEIFDSNGSGSKSILKLDVRHQPSAQGKGNNQNKLNLNRAIKVLETVPVSFATEPSFNTAICQIEEVWNDPTLEEEDPLGDLLQTHALHLQVALDSLCVRPRSILRTEHSMLKLQTVRRVDAKTLRWLSGQPGRNTAERAGARQRIKAPKRYGTIETLENKVLRSFAALTVFEIKHWLEKTSDDHPALSSIRSHESRARRVEKMLQECNVPEAILPLTPNFPLRFDRNYRTIWKAWLELIKRHMKSESEWMWQHRTFMELLVVRAAMKLHQVIREQHEGGILAFTPVLEATNPPNQGNYLSEEIGFRCTFGLMRDGSFQTIDFQNTDEANPIGTIATAGPGLELWWHDFNFGMEKNDTSNKHPWHDATNWDKELENWALRVIA